MRQFLSTNYSNSAFNLGLLVLRLGMGGLMMHHGYDKLMHFATYKKDFMNFLGLGSTTSLALVVFAEFFCAAFIVLGLFTRFAAFVLLVETTIIVFKAHHGDIFGDGEHGLLFLIGYLTILLVGAGRISADGAMGK